MDNGNKRWNWGWVTSAILVIVYTVVITSFVAANDTNTERNKSDIAKQEKIHREDMEKVLFMIREEFRYMRREINAIK